MGCYFPNLSKMNKNYSDVFTSLKYNYFLFIFDNIG